MRNLRLWPRIHGQAISKVEIHTYRRAYDVIGSEGNLILLQLQAGDARGAPLTYSGAQLPPGATLDPVTGLFVWTPDYTQHGIYKVSFTVSNGSASGVYQHGNRCQNGAPAATFHTRAGRGSAILSRADPPNDG